MYDSPSSPSKSEMDWRKESDYRALMDAAKVLVDKVRLKGAMEHMKKCKMADKALSSMVAKHSRTGRMY